VFDIATATFSLNITKMTIKWHNNDPIIKLLRVCTREVVSLKVLVVIFTEKVRGRRDVRTKKLILSHF